MALTAQAPVRAARLAAQALVVLATVALAGWSFVSLLPQEREFERTLVCSATVPRVRALLADARALAAAGLVGEAEVAARAEFELDERGGARAARWIDADGGARRLRREADGVRIDWTLEGDPRGRRVRFELAALEAAAAPDGAPRARLVWRERLEAGPAPTSRLGLAAAARTRAARVGEALDRLAAP